MNVLCLVLPVCLICFPDEHLGTSDRSGSLEAQTKTITMSFQPPTPSLCSRRCVGVSIKSPAITQAFSAAVRLFGES